jgi:mono/diheme cytochrome c family protein
LAPLSSVCYTRGFAMGLARVLGLVGLALAIAACGGSDKPSGPPTGESLFATQSCVTCHRKDGGGNNFGPSLRGTAEHWTREKMAAYLADPQSVVAKDTRLMALSRNYNMQMPSVRLSEEQRLMLADYVLGLSAKK